MSVGDCALTTLNHCDARLSKAKTTGKFGLCLIKSFTHSLEPLTDIIHIYHHLS